MAEKTEKMAEKKEKKEKKPAGEAPKITGKARYEIKYREEIVPALMKDFGYSTVMQAPRLEKIVVNMGVSNVREDPKQLDNAIGDMVIITGQKPIKTRAKKSISNFKIREDWEIGAKVTLRGRKMYDFLDRFIAWSEYGNLLAVLGELHKDSFSHA